MNVLPYFALVLLWISTSCSSSSSLAEASPTDEAAKKNAAEVPSAHPGVKVFASPRPRPAGAASEDWPCIYGPRRDGITRETKLARQFPKSGPKLLWSLDRGNGYACPTIVGDRLVYTHLRGDTAVVECLRPIDGKRWWEFRFESKYRGEIIRNNGPRASAVIADGRVFVHGIAGKLYALSLEDGRELWHRDLQKEYELPDSFFGVCSTPVAWEDLLIVNLGAGSDKPCVIALDPKTGKEVWGTPAIGGASCSSPVVVQHAGRPWALVLTGGKSRPTEGGLVALHPRTGALDFEIPWRSREFYSVNACMPTFVDGQVFIMADKGAGSAMVFLDAPGDGDADVSATPEDRIVWKNRRFGLEFVSPVLVDDRLYVFDGEARARSGLVCLDVTTGQEIWRDRLRLEGDILPGQASMLIADGDALCLSDEGTLFWLRLGADGAEKLSEVRLFDAQQSWTPPVVHRGLLFVAQNVTGADGTGPRLLCYDLRASE